MDDLALLNPFCDINVTAGVDIAFMVVPFSADSSNALSNAAVAGYELSTIPCLIMVGLVRTCTRKQHFVYFNEQVDERSKKIVGCVVCALGKRRKEQKRGAQCQRARHAITHFSTLL